MTTEPKKKGRPAGPTKVQFNRRVLPEVAARLDKYLAANSEALPGTWVAEADAYVQLDDKGVAAGVSAPKEALVDSSENIRMLLDDAEGLDMVKADLAKVLISLGEAEVRYDRLFGEFEAFRLNVNSEALKFWKTRCFKAEARVKQLEEVQS